MDPTVLERIEMPSPDIFYREYMRELRPVVVSNFFEDDLIRKVSSKQHVIQSWGSAQIEVDDEYDSAIGIEQVRLQLQQRQYGLAKQSSDSTTTPSCRMTVANYLNLVERTGGKERPRVAFAPPAAVSKSYRIPDVCQAADGESSEFATYCFVGNKRSFSQVHFDKGALHGFLYQVYGKKRFIVFPYSASRKLLPFTQYGGWFIQNFSDSDRKKFLEFTGGQETILNAGDCVFVPAFCWHFADYLDDCWAVNLRFRRPQHFTLLANALFPDIYAQGIAYMLRDPEKAKTQFAPILQEILDAWNGAFNNGVERVRFMRRLARDIYTRLCPEFSDTYSVDFEEYFPAPLPQYLDSDDPRRLTYR